jgi:hypothetical protein
MSSAIVVSEIETAPDLRGYAAIAGTGAAAYVDASGDWLCYEAFRGRLAPHDSEASDRALAACLRANEVARPRLRATAI